MRQAEYRIPLAFVPNRSYLLVDLDTAEVDRIRRQVVLPILSSNLLNVIISTKSEITVE